MGEAPFRIGFVTGTTPDRWARTWRERHRQDPLELVPVTEDQQEPRLRAGELDMVLARLPVDRDGLHCIPLYHEVQVVVAARDHLVSAAEEIELADLDDEQLLLPHRSGWTPSAPQLAWPAMTVAQAVETAAAGSGVVIVPMSVARLHHRRDVVSRVIPELDRTTVGLVWPVDNEDPRTQRFVGIVRGRTVNSSRG